MLGHDLKIDCAKINENRLIIGREINEKHALQIYKNNCVLDHRVYMSYAQYREPRFSAFKTKLLANFFFLLIFNSLKCLAISRYNFCLKIILTLKILSLLYKMYTRYRYSQISRNIAPLQYGE